MATLEHIKALPGLWRIASGTNGYLLVRDGKSLLIDCPSADISSLLRGADLPEPQIIIHTQVQEEHCLEWAAFPSVPVFVPVDCKDIAQRSARFFQECLTVWPPSRNLDTHREEKYGIAGCVTERPPAQALNVAGVLRPGEIIRWEGIELEIIALPGSGKRSLGFFWRQAGVLFSGDLLRAGGYLVNFYDCERSYGLPTGYKELRASLAQALKLGPTLALPSTGPVIIDPSADCAALIDRLDAVLYELPVRREDEPAAQTNYTPLREFGRYREVIPGVFQNNNSGNAILFIDDQGRGLMIDPDPCVWMSWEENMAEFNADLSLLESEAGLQRVEVVLATHYHGDHVEYCDLLRERYGAVIMATPDVAAIMERPRIFPYPCTIDWYGFPFDHIKVDRRIPYDQPLMWHDTAVTPIHTCGHCYAHAGFTLEWNNHRIVCTGDTLQYGAGPISMGIPVLYNDTAFPDRGTRATLQRLLDLKPDLVMGGHSFSFVDSDGSVLRNLYTVAEQTEKLISMLVPASELTRAMTPPGFNEIRPSREAYHAQ